MFTGPDRRGHTTVTGVQNRGNMLELHPDCEGCGCDLPFDSTEARICTFECTFCRSCVEGPLAGVCPNCGGDFAARPIRPAALLAKYPASSERSFRP